MWFPASTVEQQLSRNLVVRFCLAVLALYLFGCFYVFAQTSDQDVHVLPRVGSDQDQNENLPVPQAIDPALKTHTKPLKVEVDLVLLPVTVTDPLNRLVAGLEKQNFQIIENNQLQEIRHFSSEDAPISLGVIFDTSGSMSDKIEKAREAAVEFFKTANREDEFFMIAFSEKPELLADFTQSIEEVQSKLVYTVPRGRTALLDSIYLGINKMREAHNSKKALLVISDGGDNRSRYTDREIKNMVKEADVQIYSIGIFAPNPPTPEEARGPELLGEIADVTGGRTFALEDPNDLPDVAKKIGIELRNQYVLGYRPQNAVHDGRWHKVKVKLLLPKGLPHLTVYAKSGYYTPSE
jgi:Ca-activated chloride channel family protein